MFLYNYFAFLLLLQLCVRVSSDYIVTPEDAHDEEYQVLEEGGRQTVSDESILVQQKQRSLNLSTLRGWGIFLIILLCIVLICLCVCVACKLFSRSSRGLMDRLYPGIHVTEQCEAISTGRCTRINF